MDSATGIEDVESRADDMFDRVVPERHKNPRQKYALLTIVAPTGTNQTTKSGDMLQRIYGCTETLEEANAWAKRIRDSNDFFDVYTVELHEWVTLPPQVDKIDDVQFTDQRIQNIRDSYISTLKGQKRDVIERLEAVQKIRDKEAKEKEIRMNLLKPYYKDGQRIADMVVPENLKAVEQKAIDEKDFDNSSQVVVPEQVA
jgi:Family of unknown function (DUF5832)